MPTIISIYIISYISYILYLIYYIILYLIYYILYILSGRSLLMTATNGDLLYTKILKKEKGNSLEDLSRRRIYSRLSPIYYLLFIFVYLYFLLHHCVCVILVKCTLSICIHLLFSLSTITHSRFRLTAGLLLLFITKDSLAINSALVFVY